MSRLFRALCAASAVVAASPDVAFAQSTTLPQITVQGGKPARAKRPGTVRGNQAPRPAPSSTTTAAPSSLTVPTTEQARTEIERTPGAVAVVPDTQFKNAPAQTLKDIVDYVPGVWAQPKWGDDARLSIRGSGLSRNFHLRGVQLYMDGIPLNTADGYGDFQEIDPTAYRYVEVYKGANALSFGSNSLGGAINFVMPTGRDARTFESRVDAGSFGYLRGAASSGGVYGPADYFVTGSAQRQTGFRQHSNGNAEHGSANFGYQFTPDFETRFYVNANNVRQRIPGEVTKDGALNSPKTAFATNVIDDWQRNIDTVRIGNKSTLRVGSTTFDFGLYAVDRHLMHPIFLWLDEHHRGYGAFTRAVDDRFAGGFRNRFIAGLNINNGNADVTWFVNTGGQKGAQMNSLEQTSKNYSAYVENSFFFIPNVALITGTQFLSATRNQQVNFSLIGDVPGRTEFNLWSPKVGLLWDVDPTWQVFGNVSRSAEVPSYGEGGGAAVVDFTRIKAQTATTYEIGTRGRRPDYSWDLALYHADIHNELQCFFNQFGNCNVTNADRTVHQGVEAGVGVSLLKGLAVRSADPDRIWLNVAYTYSDFYYDHDATFRNNRLPGAPPHYMRAELLYKHPSGVSFGPNIEWVPTSYFVDSANTLDTQSYLLWGLKAVYDNGTNFSAYIEGRNLSDQSYIASTSIIDRANATSRLFNPGNGRAVYAGMRLKM